MTTQTKRIFKWFWIWQDLQQEEWLQRMSREGWHLQSFNRFSFTFEKGAQREYRYCLDFFNKGPSGFFSTPDQQFDEYVALLEDAGWERIGQRSGWQYLRRPVDAEGPSKLYTDIDSKITQYQRILWFTIASTPLFLVVFLGKLEVYPTWFAGLLVSIFTIGLVYGGLNFLMITLRIRELRSQQ